MNKRPLNTRLISIVQMLFVLGGILLPAKFISRYADENTYAWWILLGVRYIFPIFTTMLASFMLCTLSDMQTDYNDAIWISMPSILLYFFLEALLPFFIRFNFYAFANVCVFGIPLSLASLLLLSFATWLGSWAHRKIFRRNIINTKI